MTDAVEALILDLLEWASREPRSYNDYLETWRTSCPRLPAWEEAIERGYLVRSRNIDVTSAGLVWLATKRPPQRQVQHNHRMHRGPAC